MLTNTKTSDGKPQNRASMFHVRGVFKVILGKAPNRGIFYKRMFFRQSKFEAN